MKMILLALATSASLSFALFPTPAKADADVDFRIFFGQPYYDYRVGPDYVYRRGYGWYRPRGEVRQKLSCGEARSIVRSHGYRNITTRDCKGTTYVFRSWKNGKSHLVYINARTGGIWRG